MGMNLAGVSSYRGIPQEKRYQLNIYIVRKPHEIVRNTEENGRNMRVNEADDKPAGTAEPHQDFSMASLEA